MKYIKKGWNKYEKICKVCNIKFMGRKVHYCCSDNCRKKYYGLYGGYEGISVGTIGAIQELKVCADLLLKGYEIFRAVSPSCSCDLLAMKNNKIIRIEVRTGYINLNGKINNPKQNIKAEYLAVVLKHKIIYRPDL